MAFPCSSVRALRTSGTSPHYHIFCLPFPLREWVLVGSVSSFCMRTPGCSAFSPKIRYGYLVRESRRWEGREEASWVCYTLFSALLVHCPRFRGSKHKGHLPGFDWPSGDFVARQFSFSSALFCCDILFVNALLESQCQQNLTHVRCISAFLWSYSFLAGEFSQRTGTDIWYAARGWSQPSEGRHHMDQLSRAV